MNTPYNFREEISEITSLQGYILYENNKCYLDHDEKGKILLDGIIYISTNLGYDNLLTECLSYHIPTIIVNQIDSDINRDIWYKDMLLSYSDDVNKGNVSLKLYSV